MESRPPDPGQSDPEEALRRLERRLDEASAAAERLMAEAAAEAGRTATGGQRDRETPPAGWQASSSEDPTTRARLDPEPFVALLQSLRELIPAELQHRLAEAIREVLLAIRALIDWYLERLEQRRSSGPEVQDIPIL